MKYLCFLISLLFASHFAGAADFAGKKIRVCGDGAGWPPYTYFERENGEKTEKISGYDVDVLHEIFDPLDIKFEIYMPPWRRCLVSTDTGVDYQIAVSAAFNVKRSETYHYTDTYYSLHGAYFYNADVFSEPPEVGSFEELAELGKICGLFGYTYESYGAIPGVIDQGAKTFSVVVKKLQAGRCKFFLARKEVILGFKAIGQDLLAGTSITHHVMPWAKVDDFYMLVSRNYPQAVDLRNIINAAIARLRESGRLEEILEKYATGQMM